MPHVPPPLSENIRAGRRSAGAAGCAVPRPRRGAAQAGDDDARLALSRRQRRLPAGAGEGLLSRRRPRRRRSVAGKGSGTTAQLVASKATPIGFSDGFVVGNSVAKGMAIKTVGTIYRRDPAAIMVLADSPIKTPKDLEGKTVAMTAGSAQFQQWPAFVKGAGIDAAKIQIVNIDPAGVGPALVNGKVDAIGGYVFSYAPSIEIRGNKKLRMFWFADSGVTVVSNGIIVHQDLLKSDPDLIRAFVPAAIKGFLYGRQHLDEAIAAVKKYQPTADPAITKLEFELSWKTWVTPNTKGKPLGWGSDADWAGTIEVLKQYGGVTAPLTDEPALHQ